MKFARPLFLALAATVAAGLAPATLAQVGISPVPVVAPGNTLLTISADGQSLRKPDLAVFNAGVRSQGKTAQEALSANARAMNQVIATLKRAGIAERDIQTSNLSVSPIYSNPERDAMTAARAAGQPYVPPPEPGIARIIGYNASNNVVVRQRKLGNYGQVIDALVAAGANQINGPSFQMDNPDPALDEARLDAMRKARQRAELYAGAAGLRVLRILSISESGGYFPRPQVGFARMEAASAPPPPSPVEAGELQLGANVTVLYELTP